jgi:hypothetical protein
MSRNLARDDRRRRELQRLQVAIAKQQAETTQSRLAEPEAEQIKPVVGMPADVVLALPGYSRKDRLRSPVLVGWDRNGMKVKWYYHDVTLLLKRWEQDGVMCYRVAEIETKDND